MQQDTRPNNKLREVRITRSYIKHAEGSVLIEVGDTKVICTVSFISGVPRFLKDSGKGWLTAEYGMLPRATGTRTDREASRGKQGGRTVEIQRLIGRSLRAVVDMELLGENTLQIDCDVIQADGGTRTASITGAYVALAEAVQNLVAAEKLKQNPLKQQVAAISVGLHAGEPMLDLDYAKDSSCGTDMNVVMTEDGNFIEIQGTAERGVFTEEQLSELLKLARQGIAQLMVVQREALAKD